MAKGGLSKLKCMIKRWHSSSRISRTPTGCSARSHDGAGAGFVLEDSWRRGVAPSSVVAIGGGGRGSVSFHGADGVPPGLHPVYVGKSRRRYLIAADLVGHPLFQNLFVLEDSWRRGVAPSSVVAIGGGGRGSVSFHGADGVPPGLHPVYVGKSRRRYLIAADLVGHPLFQNLVDRSGGAGVGAGGTVVGCEVVLFEHLLWMLENAEPQPESLDELVEYYAC